jgi:hypothetical protein
LNAARFAQIDYLENQNSIAVKNSNVTVGPRGLTQTEQIAISLKLTFKAVFQCSLYLGTNVQGVLS